MIPNVDVPEPSKGVSPRFVGCVNRIHVVHLLQIWVEGAAEDVGQRERLAVLVGEQKSGLALACILPQHRCDFRMQIDHSVGARCLDPLLDFAVTNLLHNTDGQEV